MFAVGLPFAQAPLDNGAWCPRSLAAVTIWFELSGTQPELWLATPLGDDTKPQYPPQPTIRNRCVYVCIGKRTSKFVVVVTVPLTSQYEASPLPTTVALVIDAVAPSRLERFAFAR